MREAAGRPAPSLSALLSAVAGTLSAGVLTRPLLADVLTLQAGASCTFAAVAAAVTVPWSWQPPCSGGESPLCSGWSAAAAARAASVHTASWLPWSAAPSSADELTLLPADLFEAASPRAMARVACRSLNGECGRGFSAV